MKVLLIARKTARELLREPALLGIVLFFPMVLVLVYWSAFGPSAQGTAPALRVYVAQEDTGAPASNELVSALRATRFDGKPIFDLRSVGPDGRDHAAAEIALREQRAAMMVVIPAGFGRRLSESAARNGVGAEPPEIVLRGDSSSFNFLFAQSFVEGSAREFALRSTGRPRPPEQRWEFLPGTGTLSDFNIGVPGLLVFGVLFLAFSSAALVVREVTQGTLRRLQLTRIRAADLLMGITLAQLAVAAAQVSLTLGVARAVGFRPLGSIVLLALIVLLTALGAIGAGLLVACIAKSDGEANNLAAGVIVPMAFFSGAVYPLPPMTVAKVFGRAINANDFLPTTHAAEALRRVMIFGESARKVAFELSAMTALSLVLLAAGVALFQRTRLRGI